MSRLSKIVKIEGLGEITVKEVSPFAAYSALNAKNKIEHLLSMAENCVSLERKQLKELYPSEIEQLLAAFFEVNKSFLAIAERFGIKEHIVKTVAAMSSEMSKSFQPLFAASFKTVMDQELGTTDGASSSQPLKPSTSKPNKTQIN